MMQRNSLKTKDRKKIIKTLKSRVRTLESGYRELLGKYHIVDDDKSRALWFIRCYGNYIMKYGRKADQEEFKRMMKSIGGDKVKWL